MATCCLQHKRLLPRLLFKITSTLQSYTLFSMWKHYYGINWSLKIFHINPVIYHISQSDVWSVWSLSKVKCDMSRTHVSREGGVGEAKGVPDRSDGWQRKRGVEKIEEDYEEERWTRERESRVWFPVRQSPIADTEGTAGKQRCEERSYADIFCHVTSLHPLWPLKRLFLLLLLLFYENS